MILAPRQIVVSALLLSVLACAGGESLRSPGSRPGGKGTDGGKSDDKDDDDDGDVTTDDGSPSTAGEGVEVPDRTDAPPALCPGLDAVADGTQDAAPKLRECIAAAPENSVVELPPGVYLLASQLELTKPLTLTTKGRTGTAACGATAAHGCAELRAAPQLTAPYGLLLMHGPGIVIDHLVLNGNRDARPAAVAACGDPAQRPIGFSARMIECPGCAFVSSTSMNAVCGTSLEVAGVNQRISVIDSDFARNGVHSVKDGWSDGLTVHDVSGGVFRGNHFRDNTDVDLIFGGCQSCAIEANVITHDGTYEHGSFAALMIQAFALSTSGRYDGSAIHGNTIDCGNKLACGYGLYVGSRSWYEASRIVNGDVYDNVVSNAQGGILIGRDVTGTRIGDNDAGPSNGQARCNTLQEGLRQYHALAVETGSEAVFAGGRVGRNLYVEVLYNVGTIPNSAPGCE